jgi:flavin-dependent dehydrogenase
MLVLEKSAHPRHKLCGGGVTRFGLEILKGLGFDLPLPLPQARVDDIRLVYGSRVVHVRGQPQIMIFHRSEFDAYLADRARQRGVVIRENEPVQSFEVGGEGVTLRTDRGSYCARVLVGADGSKGIVRRYFGRQGSRTRVARLLEVIHEAPETSQLFTERCALFDFTPVRRDLQGYFWDFPTRVNGEPRYNRGVYDARVSRARSRAHLPQLLYESLSSLGVGQKEIHPEGHPIHWFSPRNQFARPRLLLVGDAAGADPLFGEGIGPALGYGQVAARVLQRAFRENDFTFRDYRRQVLFSHLGRYMMLRWAVAWGSYRLSGHPWFMHYLWTLGGAVARMWPKPTSLFEPTDL